MSSFLLKNATIINEGETFQGNLYVKEGKIQRISREPLKESFPVNYEIDAQGLWVIPGVIDDQVHFREPGLTHKADIYTESKAAVAGGITSFMEMPNTSPQTVTLALLREKFVLASRKSLANYSFYLGATNDNIKEIVAADPETTCGIKVFMGSSTGNMLVNNRQSLEEIFKNTSLPVAVHCEDETTIQKNMAVYRNRYGDHIPIKYHPEIRSEEACYRSSSLAVELATKHNTRLHVLHLSTARELSLFQPHSDTNKKRITAEVCVHHLWFSNHDYDKKGTLIKWNPAIKTPADRSALFQAVLNGQIDVIATDHAPHTLEEKENSYTKAPSGGPLVQHALVAMLEFYHQGKISLEQIVEKMCHSPARIFQVKNRGFIREGYWADLVLIDPWSPWKVTKNNILYKCGWSPFEEESFRSKVTHTFVNGNLVYQNTQNSAKVGIFQEETKGMQLGFNR